MTTPQFLLMDNAIQNYAWGSTTSISELFDISNPSNEPQAEIWMGAHPRGCSKVLLEDKWLRLDALIEQAPENLLSSTTFQRFGELPYLFKVLAAAQALSIQVHPSKEEAEVGFAKENQANIPLDAAERNYKDPNHKPELVYALTEYHALNGFRPLSDVISAFELLNISVLSPLLENLKSAPTEESFQTFFIQLLELDAEKKPLAVDALLSYAEANKSEPLMALIIELSQSYPGDIGLFSPLMLHYVVLEPTQAMYLDARTPHAYLKGTGLEVMANSDNVLRAGLTPKHIDVAELAACTSFAEKPASTLLVEPQQENGALIYPIPVEDFRFAIYPQPSDERVTANSAEIIFAIDEQVTLHHDNGETLTLDKGQSAFIPASTAQYNVTSNGRVARVFN